MKQYYIFGQAYGEGSYGSCNYQATNTQQDACAGTTTGTSTGSNGGAGSTGSGSLVNTGVAIAFAVTLACLIIFVALVVRIWHRPKAVAQEVRVDNDDTDFRS